MIPDLDALTDALFGPNYLKGLGVFAALGTPVELREWLKERIAPKVQELLRGAVEERERLTEWRTSVLNKLNSFPEFTNAKWADNTKQAREGWGFVYEFIGWLYRERAALTEERDRLRTGLGRNVCPECSGAGHLSPEEYGEESGSLADLSCDHCGGTGYSQSGLEKAASDATALHGTGGPESQAILRLHRALGMLMAALWKSGIPTLPEAWQTPEQAAFTAATLDVLEAGRNAGVAAGAAREARLREALQDLLTWLAGSGERELTHDTFSELQKHEAKARAALAGAATK